MEWQLDPISENRRLFIFDGKSLIHESSVPPFDASAEKARESQVDVHDDFTDENGNEFRLAIHSSKYELYITLDTSREDTENITVELDKPEAPFNVKMKYMPFMQVTRRTKEIVNVIKSSKVIPYLSIIDIDVIQTNKRKATYDKAQISIPHYVDYFDEIDYPSKAIKSITITEESRLVKQAILKLQTTEKHIAFKFETQDIEFIKRFIDLVFTDCKITVIINVGYINNSGINRRTVTELLLYFSTVKIEAELFILSSSIPENINTVCTTSDQSIIDNQALSAYYDLEITDERLHFGDFAGYEVSTPTEFVQGMKIVPKTIMLSKSGFQILIVRTCNNNYQWKEGMEAIFDKLKNDPIYNNFTHHKNDGCEGCDYLLDGGRSSTTPEMVKISCMKHNIFVMQSFI